MKKIFVNVVVAFGILTFASCLKDNDGTTNPTQGALMVANLSPDVSSMNLTLNAQAYITGLQYGIYVPYNLIKGGTYNAVVASSSATVVSDSIKIEPNKYYSYFVLNSPASPQYAFIEDKLATPGSDSASIRFLNFSPDAGTINLRDSATHNYFYTSRSFNDQSSNGANASFKQVKQGIYTLELVAADSTVIASKKDTLAAGHIYTILGKGLLHGTDTKALGLGKIVNY